MDKLNLLISFSGGKTSAYMTKYLLENKRDDFNEIIVTFANTGQENEETLEFINKCDKEWNFNVVWLEAVINPEMGKGTRHKIVSFEKADRTGIVFEEYIKKLGITNQPAPTCTRELKLAPMTSYLRSMGWKNGTYKTAIGIRFDEMDRVSANFEKNNVIYPLIEYQKTTKEMITLWFEKQLFNLNLLEHQGNCKWRWKKSKRKLLTLAVDTPEVFDFPIKMEKLYKFHRAELYNQETGRVFFRNNKSALDLLEESELPFKKWKPQAIQINLFDEVMDSAGACSESCEVY